MADENKPTSEDKVACEICLKEVPISEAKNSEAQDYVFHFCGIDCFSKWKEQQENETE